MRNPSALYLRPIRNAHTLKYNESFSTFDHWNCGKQYIGLMLTRSLAISQRMRGRDVELGDWGFKHPRTSLLLPFWVSALQDKFVFVTYCN